MAIVIVYIDFSSLSLTIYNSTFSCQIKKRNRQSKRHWQQHYNGKCKKKRNVTANEAESYFNKKKTTKSFKEKRKVKKSYVVSFFFAVDCFIFNIWFYTIYIRSFETFLPVITFVRIIFDRRKLVYCIDRIRKLHNRNLINTDFIRLCVCLVFVLQTISSFFFLRILFEEIKFHIASAFDRMSMYF